MASFSTKCVQPDPAHLRDGSFNVPIHQNSTFQQTSPGEWEQFTYTRTKNPTDAALADKLSELDEASGTVVFSSGLAAINAVCELFGQGDAIVAMGQLYGGTHRLLSRFATNHGLEFSWVDTTNLEVTQQAMSGTTKAIFTELPSNPQLLVSDVSALARIAHDHDALLVVDNSLSTAMASRPLTMGADIVVYSTSKHYSGHTNVVGGAVSANDPALVERLALTRKATGAVPGPFDVYQTLLGIKTLPLRMERHSENAMTLARLAEQHENIQAVYYPGLESHPNHELAKRDLDLFGGLVTLDLDSEDRARRFISKLDLFGLSVSFGSVQSLVECPALMSHKDIPKPTREASGVSDGMVRLSVGIEALDDLADDVASAFESL